MIILLAGCWGWFGYRSRFWRMSAPPPLPLSGCQLMLWYYLSPNPLFHCSRVIVLLLLISRSKLVPDFALTLHFLHLLATSLYTWRIPTHLLWWGLQAGSVAVMVSVGIWACRLRELRPISFGKAVAVDDTGSEAGKPEGTQEDPSIDRHIRGGNGRGRNRDEGPSYEMLAIKEENGEAA